MKRIFLLALLVTCASAIAMPSAGKLLGFNQTASAACTQGGEDNGQGDEDLGDFLQGGNENCNAQK